MRALHQTTLKGILTALGNVGLGHLLKASGNLALDSRHQVLMEGNVKNSLALSIPLTRA
jgi:hypothetical protein